MITCISIDDEPLAHKIVKSYCDRLEFLDLVGSFKSAVDALAYLNQEAVDLIFLDIHMPVLKGLDFLRTLRNPPLVIITSAHQEYALEGYELDVVDYLLKPFPFDRFLKAVIKAQGLKKMQSPEKASVSSRPIGDGRERIFVKSEKKTHQLKLLDILYLESAGSYVKIHLDEGMVMVLDRLSHFEQRLPGDRFIRVHKSFIVSIPKIQIVEGNRIFMGGHEIPIGQVYKMNLRKIME